MTPTSFLILGCGYVGRRVAERLAAKGLEVLATSRKIGSADIPGVTELELDLGGGSGLDELSRRVREGVAVLHSIPPVQSEGGLLDPTPMLIEALGKKPARVVYLSTTSVYGRHRVVDERTPPAPVSLGARLRVAAEERVLGGPWAGMVLRPAAIYGPGRGAQVSIPRGDFKLMGDGSNYVSRIHVDDLAALAEAALMSRETGAWPVADEKPATSREVAEFVCRLLGCAMPASAPEGELHETRRADRRVDGRAVCRLLGVALRYRSYETGIPESVQAKA